MSSVLSQEYKDLEYLVVDPGSTDDTPKVIRDVQDRYPGKIVVIEEPDKGPADGLNKAFARANGDLFGYLNADDLYLPGCFERAVAVAQRYPRAGAIYADGYKADANGRVTRHVISTRFGPKKFVNGGSLALQQSTFYRREAFRAVRGFNVQNRTSWDAELLLEMAMAGIPLVHVAGYWSVFRIHNQSITGSQRLAEESRATHARYFQRVMGRERRRSDRWLAMAVKACSHLLEPRGTALRILDMMRKPHVDITRYLHDRQEQ